MALSRLDTGTRVGDMAFEAIQAAITAGEYEAGDRLQVRDLAAKLGVSVMPVREAIAKLEKAGLVETVQYRGAIVRAFTPHELLNIYGVRRLLEAEAAKLGTSKSTDSDHSELERLLGEIKTAVSRGNVRQYLDLDEQILLKVYAASGNEILLETIQSLWARCRHYKILGTRQSLQDGDSKSLLSHQERLVSAVKVRDSTAAISITMSSLDEAMERIRGTISPSE